jgi:hypothetical protein
MLAVNFGHERSRWRQKRDPSFGGGSLAAFAGEDAGLESRDADCEWLAAMNVRGESVPEK